MARKGRDLEELIALLEKGLSGTDIKITSPDYLVDKITGSKREVDISLRGTFGSNNILIIIECRDRKGAQDVTWIEQLATKCEDVGANKAIAVSSDGFTSGAIAKASFRNIELRTLDEINQNEILGWFQAKSFGIYHRYYSITKAIFQDSDLCSDHLQKLEQMCDSDPQKLIKNKMILQKGLSEPITLNELFQRINLDDIFSDIQLGEEPVIKNFILHPDDPETGYQLLIDDAKMNIPFIKITVEFSIKFIEAGIEDIKAYKKGDETLTEVINFEEVDIFGKKQSIEIHRIPQDDGSKIRIRFAERSK